MLFVLGLDWEQTWEKRVFLKPTMSKKLPEIFVLILLTSVITATSLRSCLSLQVSFALSITSLTFPRGSLHPLELKYPFLQVSQIWHCSSDFALFLLFSGSPCAHFLPFAVPFQCPHWPWGSGSLLWTVSGGWQHWDERQSYFELINSDHNP